MKAQAPAYCGSADADERRPFNQAQGFLQSLESCRGRATDPIGSDEPRSHPTAAGGDSFGDRGAQGT